jgi:hypothetical protein
MNRLGIGALAVLLVLTAAGCDRAEPLTAEKAQEIVGDWSFKREPVYAEVPQRVWWNPKAPKDEYDGKALETLRNLEKAGLVTVTGSESGDSAEFVAKVTDRGFRILGTAPSARGPVYRAMICEKVYDGLRNFVRHPTEPTVGHAELTWHYANPTPLYPMFTTAINKPLSKPFATHVSFWHEENQWKFSVNVRKAETGA